MRTRLSRRQRELLDELCEEMIRGDLNPQIIRRNFAAFDATVTDGLTREISSRFKELLRDMPAAGEIREDLLALLNSWGDRLEDEDVLDMLNHNGRVFRHVFADASRARS